MQTSFSAASKPLKACPLLEGSRVYEGVRELELSASGGELAIGVSRDNHVYIQGLLNAEPTFARNKLIIPGFQGVLYLPKLDNVIINQSSGALKGDVSQPITIFKKLGPVDLRVIGHVGITAEVVSTGRVNLNGIYQGNKLTTETPGSNVGKLNITVDVGQINLTLVPNKVSTLELKSHSIASQGARNTELVS